MQIHKTAEFIVTISVKGFFLDLLTLENRHQTRAHIGKNISELIGIMQSNFRGLHTSITKICGGLLVCGWGGRRFTGQVGIAQTKAANAERVVVCSSRGFLL